MEKIKITKIEKEGLAGAKYYQYEVLTPTTIDDGIGGTVVTWKRGVVDCDAFEEKLERDERNAIENLAKIRESIAERQKADSDAEILPISDNLDIIK